MPISRVSARRRPARGGLALLAFAALGLGAAPSAGAASTEVSTTQQAAQAQRDYYTIRAVHSQKCLGTYGNWTGTDVQIVQQPCDGRPSQRFSVKPYTNRYGESTQIITTGAGLCLGTTEVNVGPGDSKAFLYVSLRTQNCGPYGMLIEFHPYAGAHGYVIYEYVPQYGPEGQCLHVAGANTADNAGVIHHPCNWPGEGQRNDQFAFLPVWAVAFPPWPLPSEPGHSHPHPSHPERCGP
ncbi:RICIN domain-containing protein [Streptomyces sp. NPDC006798]|uniref:RICIN domain-containing protein n=1 Tax=Streptomyces sp. NPDC006798 TaxID=3155462 RepID=UPI0033CAEE2F